MACIRCEIRDEYSKCGCVLLQFAFLCWIWGEQRNWALLRDFVNRSKHLALSWLRSGTMNSKTASKFGDIDQSHQRHSKKANRRASYKEQLIETAGQWVNVIGNRIASSNVNWLMQWQFEKKILINKPIDIIALGLEIGLSGKPARNVSLTGNRMHGNAVEKIPFNVDLPVQLRGKQTPSDGMPLTKPSCAD